MLPVIHIPTVGGRASWDDLPVTCSDEDARRWAARIWKPRGKFTRSWHNQGADGVELRHEPGGYNAIEIAADTVEHGIVTIHRRWIGVMIASVGCGVTLVETGDLDEAIALDDKFSQRDGTPFAEAWEASDPYRLAHFLKYPPMLDRPGVLHYKREWLEALEAAHGSHNLW